MIRSIKKFLKEQPYFLFVVAALVLLVFTFLLDEGLVDIHIYDAMFLLSLTDIIWGMIVGLLLTWGTYRLLNGILISQYLTWFHIIVTIGVFGVAIIYMWQNAKPDLNLNVEGLAKEFRREEKVYSFLIILLVMAQLGFTINFIGGLFKKW